MAPSPVTRHLGLFGLLVPLLGCAHDVELLSSSSYRGNPTYMVGAAGGPRESGGSTDQGGVPASAGFGGSFAAGSVGFAGALFGAGGDALATGGAPIESGGAGGDTNLGGSPAAEAGAGGYAGGGVAGSCGGGGCTACRVDGECAYGSEWCDQGACVPCSSEGPACTHGWAPKTLPRNGCIARVCVPPSECHTSADCGSTQPICYAGALCPAGCAAGDATCCEGNFCSGLGCDGATVPLTCTQRGCPLGQTCVGPVWTKPDCSCSSTGAWSCVTAPPSSQCF